MPFSPLPGSSLGPLPSFRVFPFRFLQNVRSASFLSSRSVRVRFVDQLHCSQARRGHPISLPLRPPRSPALLLGSDFFLHLLTLPEIPLIGHQARFAPLFYLRGEDPLGAAVLSEFGLVERVRLQDDQEFVLGTPAFGLFSVSRRGRAAAAHFVSPLRQGHVRDAALLRQSHDGYVLRRHHLPHD